MLKYVLKSYKEACLLLLNALVYIVYFIPRFVFPNPWRAAQLQRIDVKEIGGVLWTVLLNDVELWQKVSASRYRTFQHPSRQCVTEPRPVYKVVVVESFAKVADLLQVPTDQVIKAVVARLSSELPVIVSIRDPRDYGTGTALADFLSYLETPLEAAVGVLSRITVTDDRIVGYLTTNQTFTADYMNTLEFRGRWIKYPNGKLTLITWDLWLKKEREND